VLQFKEYCAALDLNLCLSGCNAGRVDPEAEADALLDQPTLSPPSPTEPMDVSSPTIEESVLKLVPQGYDLLPVNINIGTERKPR